MVSCGALLTQGDAPVLQCVIGYTTSLYLVMNETKLVSVRVIIATSVEYEKICRSDNPQFFFLGGGEGIKPLICL